MDDRLEHRQRRGIGGGIGPPRLAEHAGDLGHRLDQAIGLLEQFGRLGGRNARERRWHVEHVALVDLRHELAAELADRPQAGRKDEPGNGQRRLGARQDPVERGPVDARQPAVDRIGVLGRDLAADQIAHQHRDQRNRQQRRARHRIAFGEREWREQSAFLPLKAEHRDEREGDDQQRQEQRRPHLDRGFGDQPPPVCGGRFAVVMVVTPSLDMLVRILDHHDRGIDHRADRDRDPAERHDIRVDPLDAHHDQRDHDPERQRDDRDERRADVPKEQPAHEADDDELLDQLAVEILDRAIDQRRPVIGRNDLDAGRQALGKFGKLGLDVGDRGARILA